MRNMKIFLTLLYLSFLITSVSFAETFDRSYIENLARKHLEAEYNTPSSGKISIKLSKIDPRININPCNSPLKVNIPEKTNSRNVNIKISCEDSTAWHIYLNGKVEIKVPVLVAKTQINKGSILDASNVYLIYQSSRKIRGTVLTDVNKVFGGKTNKRISKGKPINRNNICFVCEGEDITIIAKSDIFSIKTIGIALSDGNIGDQVKVKNKKSGRIITAQVNAINKVLINL